jgi:hypothetical protein
MLLQWESHWTHSICGEFYALSNDAQPCILDAQVSFIWFITAMMKGSSNSTVRRHDSILVYMVLLMNSLLQNSLNRIQHDSNLVNIFCLWILGVKGHVAEQLHWKNPYNFGFFGRINYGKSRHFCLVAYTSIQDIVMTMLSFWKNLCINKKYLVFHFPYRLKP